MMRALLLALSATALAFLAWGAVAAGDRVEVAAGHDLVRAWCTSCHAVEPGQTVGPYADVPSFTTVARMPSTTAAALHAFLRTPHQDMPDIRFTQDQLDDVVSYILSLREK